ncbi:MAG TPA: isoprenyl transferase [Armatimonadota bacterium]
MSVPPSEASASPPEASGTLDELVAQLIPDRLPRHIALIMDGNGRWARLRSQPRIAGHHQGHLTVRRVVELCRDLGVEMVTLYAFSSENWSRPDDEVEGLMSLIEGVARLETPGLHEDDVRLRILGRMHELPDSLQDELNRGMELTRSNTGLALNLAVNYSGRAEIVDAVRKIVSDGIDSSLVDESTISDALYTAGLPDPDLLIRTAGEMRVSNFLLWQIAYAELYVTETLWPDFSKEEMCRALLSYQKRVRRFGGVVSP